MAIVEIPKTYFPRIPSSTIGAPGFATALVLDAGDETATMIVEAPKTGNIDAIYFGTRNVTTGATVDVRVETLDRTTTPAVNSGTLWGTNTNGAQVIADGDDNTGFTTVLTAVAAVTRGDPIAVVIKNPAVSPGNMQLAILSDGKDELEFPYFLLNGVSSSGGAVVLGLRYDDGSFYPITGAYPISAITTTTYSSASTPDTIGQRFQFAAPVRVCGFWTWADFDGDLTVKLVSSDYHQANNTATLKVEKTINNEDRRSNGAFVQEFLFPTDVDLTAATNYRLIFEPGGTNITIYDMTFDSLAIMAGRDGGSAFHLTTAKDPTGDGDWTNYNSGTFRKLFGGLILCGVDDGAGAGGVLVPGGFTGGMQR